MCVSQRRSEERLLFLSLFAGILVANNIYDPFTHSVRLEHNYKCLNAHFDAAAVFRFDANSFDWETAVIFMKRAKEKWKS